jgi:hypothetical protein
LSDLDEAEHQADVEPERDGHCDEYENKPWNPEAQIHAQLTARQLAELHAEIKARAETPEPAYPKLPWSWPFRPFDIRILPDYVEYPIHYFELFWGLDVFNMLVQNTNAYAQYKDANANPKTRWWKPVTLYEMRIFIALLIHIGLVGTSHIASCWDKAGNVIHKPMEYMSLYRFEQIKRYLHMSPPPLPGQPTAPWYMKVEPLASLLRAKFQAYAILGQNVSFDEMMIPYSGRSQHTLKMPNKPISEGFKVWALCDRGYLWDFLFYSRLSG